MENSTFSTKICLKNGFRFGISKNLFQNKNQYPKDLGLKFEKTHVEIRISILEILYVCVYECMSVCMCVYVCVCVCVCVCVPIFSQNKEFWLFPTKFGQKWI